MQLLKGCWLLCLQAEALCLEQAWSTACPEINNGPAIIESFWNNSLFSVISVHSLCFHSSLNPLKCDFCSASSFVWWESGNVFHFTVKWKSGFAFLSLSIFSLYFHLWTLNFRYKTSYQSESFFQHASQGLGLLKQYIHLQSLPRSPELKVVSESPVLWMHFSFCFKLHMLLKCLFASPSPLVFSLPFSLLTCSLYHLQDIFSVL